MAVNSGFGLAMLATACVCMCNKRLLARVRLVYSGLGWLCLQGLANASKCALPAAADLGEAGVVCPTQEKGFDQIRLQCASVDLGLNNVFAVALLVYVFVILVTLGHHGECVSQHCVIGEAATGVFVRRVQVRNAGHDASVCGLCTPEGFNTRALGLIQARTTSSSSR
jgi:hypothetical protein